MLFSYAAIFPIKMVFKLSARQAYPRSTHEDYNNLGNFYMGIRRRFMQTLGYVCLWFFDGVIFNSARAKISPPLDLNIPAVGIGGCFIIIISRVFSFRMCVGGKLSFAYSVGPAFRIFSLREGPVLFPFLE